LKKLHLGSGGADILGWENHDLDVDLRKPLPHQDGSVDFMFTEHCVEHLTPAEAWGFFEECHRVLRRGGVVRTTVPCIAKIFLGLDQEYLDFVKKNGWGDGSLVSGVKHIVCQHGHQSLWNPALLITLLGAIGFDAYEAPLHKSLLPELQNVEQHWRSVGRKFSDQESISVEAIKS
jgi:SAM-dependent methyltransferase